MQPDATATIPDPAALAGLPADPAELIGLEDAARLHWPRRAGRPAHRCKLWRLATAGRRTADGRRVQLRTLRDGSRLLTCKAWIAAYFAELQPATPPPALQPPPAPPATSEREQRRRSHANRRETPQMRPEAVATLRRHGLADAVAGAKRGRR